MSETVERKLIWMGQTRKDMQSFPIEVRRSMGASLYYLQLGGMPKGANSFKGVGSGVLEIRLRYGTNAYRTVLAVQLGEKIYVLHAFQKKSKSGAKTPKNDVELIRQRYKEAQELEKNG
ncbi:protein of unknown function DUF891 [Desulfatibacillum aliphaticivorans]|uniref:Type II toxin-antitoxin system RelE/ParE family toxin n=1 Tax=Desulfatibacillum aliphaticivorans TaxID=218208 RepID=B8FLH5_DESAL|nr:type II toxin-antitoxin system RelE/ParE family toxin [Desulfatibacillum aliphaticivorans]ACL05121.1 protein of unknown function DUF891 [Desulfatibacillum aliphaticivorans]